MIATENLGKVQEALEIASQNIHREGNWVTAYEVDSYKNSAGLYNGTIRDTDLNRLVAQGTAESKQSGKNWRTALYYYRPVKGGGFGGFDSPAGRAGYVPPEGTPFVPPIVGPTVVPTVVPVPNPTGGILSNMM